MKSIKTCFKPRARIMVELGEQLIKNESVAVLELVKNSYDAFASKVSVVMNNLDDVESGEIVIEDNGIGMDLDTVLNHWMEPATSNKKKIVESMRETISHNGITRVPLGEKGIGRFGAHKLGDIVRLTTRGESSDKEIFWEIDWTEFDSDKYLSDIEVSIIERDPQVFLNGKTGTKLEICRLRHVWTRGEFRSVYKNVLTLNSPFQHNDSFTASVESNMDGWAAGLTNFDELLKRALFRATVEIEGDRITSYEYEFTPWAILSKVKPRKNEMLTDPLLHDISSKEYIPINLSKYKIGKIVLELRMFDMDSYILNLGFPDDKRVLQNYLKRNGGIAIYRDNMRLYEYGEESNDWLGLETRRINNPSKTISSRLVIGAVNINRIESGDLIEKTSREGFIENDAYQDFTKAVLYAVSCVENDRMLDKADLRTFYSNIGGKMPVIDSINKLNRTVEKKVKDPDLRREIQSALTNIENEYVEMSRVYVKSASLGMNLSMVVHEVGKIIFELEKGVEIEKASEHVKKLVSDLSMRISSYSELIKNTKSKEVTLSKLVSSALNIIKYRINAHELHIINDVENCNIKVSCAENMVRSAIMNIIDNSIYWLTDYRIETKKIMFMHYSPEPGYEALLIVDNGLGFTIPKDKLTLPFVSKKEGGMGLGLNLVEQIMDLVGGKVLFPDNMDFDLPVEFHNGAAIALVFKEARE